MFKRMPVFDCTFIILTTFLMCGSVIGAFCGVYVENFEIANTFDKNFMYYIFQLLKYNILVILLTKKLGFLIPVVVIFRGFILAFSLSALYSQTTDFLYTTIIIESLVNDLISLPCFIIISTVCLNIYFNNKMYTKSKSKLRAEFDNNYAHILLFLVFNVAWNSFCGFIF